MHGSDILTAIPEGVYDFFDFGCSNGGSLEFGQHVLGGQRGLGFDLNADKVAKALESGYEARQADVTKLATLPNHVRFVIMSHFLEHLPGFKDAKLCIEAACATARDFVLIRQPWFDADSYLFVRGLKLYWSDWKGHTYAMSSLDLYRILTRVPGVRRWRMYGRHRICDSASPIVHPLASPINQHEWERDVHPPKPTTTFDQAIYRELFCLVDLGGADLDDLEKRCKFLERFFDSEKAMDP